MCVCVCVLHAALSVCVLPWVCERVCVYFQKNKIATHTDTERVKPRLVMDENTFENHHRIKYNEREREKKKDGRYIVVGTSEIIHTVQLTLNTRAT